MLTVHAKFRCIYNDEPIYVKKLRETQETVEAQRTVHFTAVSGDDGTANAEWSRWTPCGDITINITNPAAFEQFKVGKDYILTFLAADD